MTKIDTTNIVLEFGKAHRGERVQRVPVSYLTWMVNDLKPENGNAKWIAIAKAELERRGTTMPTMEISGHAIDRASLNPAIRAIWHETAAKDEGLHSWMLRMGALARIEGLVEKQGEDEVAYYQDIKWVFSVGNNWPTLKTLMPKMRREDDKD